MLFAFDPIIQAGINAGKYAGVVTNSGVPISVARDLATGRFVGHAIGTVGTIGNPLFAVPQFVMGGSQMYQAHRGFQAIQASLGVLQSTTAFIGVGTVATVGLSAVNLWQTLKLRQDVKQLKLEVKEGFIDLKQAVNDRTEEIKQHLDLVAKDVKFEQQRVEFVKAYGLFLEASNLIQTTLYCDDIQIKNADLANARQTLNEALSIYNNPQFLEETSAAGHLRRVECSWAIEQAIASTYQVQNQFAAARQRISHLEAKIRQDALQVIDRCQTEEELDFLFPELLYIHDQDLPVLDSWQVHLDWMRSLPPAELKLLQAVETPNTATSELPEDLSIEPPEIAKYQALKNKSHFRSLYDQMKLMMQPTLRQNFIEYVSQKAAEFDRPVLCSANLEPASNLTLANLYHYFQR
ncbi:MAG: hypothetical protein WBG66_20425 [Geitlerinemataceae cyanobacterium]